MQGTVDEGIELVVLSRPWLAASRLALGAGAVDFQGSGRG
jgi:hypothetical protein